MIAEVSSSNLVREHRLEKGILSVFVLLGTYFGSVIVVQHLYPEAFSNARIMKAIESGIGIWHIERWSQSLSFPGANALYWASEFAVIYGLLVALLIFRRKYAWSFWLAVVAVNAVGCIFFVLIPMSPPWALLHLYGPGIRSIGNAIGAFPSIHQADAVLVGRYLRIAFRHRLVTVLGVGWELLVALDVVVTGNHYLLDVVAGGMLGWFICKYEGRRCSF